jgi:thiosulfate/3-mercaptopyruvate sulfurtransferase
MDLLVSPLWIISNQHKRNIVIVDATLKKTMNTHAPTSGGVIPDAIYFDLEKEFSDLTTGLPHSFPRLSSMASSMAGLGINSESTVVVYDQQGAYSAPRVWWMLKVMGVKNVYLLDGGMSAWQQAGYKVSSHHRQPIATLPIQFAPQPEHIIDKNFLNENLNSRQAVIIDARPSARFDGIQAEPRSGLRKIQMHSLRYSFPGAFLNNSVLSLVVALVLRHALCSSLPLLQDSTPCMFMMDPGLNGVQTMPCL